MYSTKDREYYKDSHNQRLPGYEEEFFDYLDDDSRQTNIKLETFKLVSFYFWFSMVGLIAARHFFDYIGQTLEAQYLHFFIWSMIMVFINGIGLYFLIKSQLSLLKKANENIREAYQELSETYKKMLATEEELIKQQALTESIIKKTPAIISVIDSKSSHVVRLNEFALKKFGYSAEELIGQHNQKYTLTVKHINNNMLESIHLNKDGSTIDVLWNY